MLRFGARGRWRSLRGLVELVELHNLESVKLKRGGIAVRAREAALDGLFCRHSCTGTGSREEERLTAALYVRSDRQFVVFVHVRFELLLWSCEILDCSCEDD